MTLDPKELEVQLYKRSTTDHEVCIKLTREAHDYIKANCRLDWLADKQWISIHELVVGLSKQL